MRIWYRNVDKTVYVMKYNCVTCTDDTRSFYMDIINAAIICQKIIIANAFNFTLKCYFFLKHVNTIVLRFNVIATSPKATLAID